AGLARGLRILQAGPVRRDALDAPLGSGSRGGCPRLAGAVAGGTVDGVVGLVEGLVDCVVGRVPQAVGDVPGDLLPQPVEHARMDGRGQGGESQRPCPLPSSFHWRGCLLERAQEQYRGEPLAINLFAHHGLITTVLTPARVGTRAAPSTRAVVE